MTESEKITSLAGSFRKELDRLDEVLKNVESLFSSFETPVRENLGAFFKEFDRQIDDAKCTLSGLASTAIQNWHSLSSTKGKEVVDE